MDDVDQLLAGGGGAPGAKFVNVGDMVQGEIISARTQQQTDVKTGDPKFFKSGDPMMEMVITIQTDERRPDIEDDDGRRSIYAKGSANRKGILDGLRTALKGTTGLRTREKHGVGGQIVVKYTGDGQRSAPGFSPPKNYAVGYKAPIEAAVSLPSEASSTDADDLPF